MSAIIEGPTLSTRSTVCVLGLGYIGLPTATMFAIRGHSVVGVDPNPRIRTSLGDGSVRSDEPDLAGLVRAALESGRFQVQAEPEPADAFIIAVPTPFDPMTSRANLRYVEQAALDLLPHLRPGNLVILESTVPPGTTRDWLVPLLAQSGLVPGQDLYIAHCPERVLPGRLVQELVGNDRLAGGFTRECARRAADLYASFVEGELITTDATTAEMVKIMENTSRDINIAIANEFALVAEHVGVDVWQAIALANRHPRVNVLRPGPGVGGHCIAVDPWFLVQAAPDDTPLTRAARRLNDEMPNRVVRRLRALVCPPARVALLGLTYKANVDDIRESPALRIAELVVEQGFDVRLHDPHVPPQTPGLPAPLVSFDRALRNADVVVLLVDHAAILERFAPKLVAELVSRRCVLDTRGVLARQLWTEAGFGLAVLGVGEHTTGGLPQAAGSLAAYELE